MPTEPTHYKMDRRGFIKKVVKGGGALAGGVFLGHCQLDRGMPKDKKTRDALLGKMPFSLKTPIPFEELIGKGLGGRRYTNLSELTADFTLLPSEKYFVRTREPLNLPTAQQWKIEIGGLVQKKRSLSLHEIEPWSLPQGNHIMECAGNDAMGQFGLVGMAEWQGIPLKKIFDEIIKPLNISPSAAYIQISGYDNHDMAEFDPSRSLKGANWIFDKEELINSGAFLATHLGGKPLSNDHGAPLRLLVPGYYGCAQIKWVNQIDFLPNDCETTEQMREYASRTQQKGVPRFVRDYRPAKMELTAVPTRVEKWKVDDKIEYRIGGLLWGGEALNPGLLASTDGHRWSSVDMLSTRQSLNEWSLWSWNYRPEQVGERPLYLKFSNITEPTRRMDLDYYLRRCNFDEV